MFFHYCQTEESPYLKEQDEYSEASPKLIQFKKGILHVRGVESSLIKYLLAFDGNADKEKVNPRTKLVFKYKMVDEEAEFKSSADLRKLRHKVQEILLKSTRAELTDFLKESYGFKPKTSTLDEVLDEALRHADLDPAYVLKTFNTEESKTKALILKCMEANLLKEEKGALIWVETGLQINVFKVPANEDLVDHIWDWIAKQSKEAKDFAKKLDGIVL